LAPVAQYIRNIPFGYLILFALVLVSSFPPIPGYSIILIICGFIYGFPIGFFPAFGGALIGSILCFGLFRITFKNYTDELVSKDRRFAALAIAIHNEGFKIIFLVRLSPFPFPYTNAFFASLPSVSFWEFFLATIITLPQQLITIFIGSRFSNLSNEMDFTSRLVNYLSIGIGCILFLFAAWYIYYKTMMVARNAAGKGRMIEKSESERGLKENDDNDSSEYFLDQEITFNDDELFSGIGHDGVGTSKSARSSQYLSQPEISMYQIQK
ncbi:hypothetical protein G9A89_000508, partial [Geosiphon pyriformis]